MGQRRTPACGRLPRTKLGPLLLSCIVIAAAAIAVVPRVWRGCCMDPAGEQLLLSAAGRGDVEGVRRALAQGVGPDETETGITALCVTNDPEVARLLIARGARVEGSPADRVTPLSNAAMCGRAGVVRVLLEAGANPNHRNRVGVLTPLAAARLGRNEQVIRLLLEHGAKDTDVAGE